MISKLDKYEKADKYYLVVFLTTRGMRGLLSTRAANRDVTGSRDGGSEKQMKKHVQAS